MANEKNNCLFVQKITVCKSDLMRTKGRFTINNTFTICAFYSIRPKYTLKHCQLQQFRVIRDHLTRNA